jgi:hypothetical protein
MKTRLPPPCSFVFFLIFPVESVFSYSIGEHIETSVFTITGGSEALSKQRPLFGVNSLVTFPRSRSNDRFSLSFAEGYHQLPWFDTSSLGKLRVSFVFSKSGDGVIHSVSSEPVMRVMHDDHSRHNIQIEYVWIEEQPVDFQSGLAVMFLATFLVALVLQICRFGSASGKQEATVERMRPTGSLTKHDE